VLSTWSYLNGLIEEGYWSGGNRWVGFYRIGDCNVNRWAQTQKWSRVLDPETFQPLPNEALLECFGIAFSEADLAKITAFKEKDSVQVSLKLADFLMPLPSEEEQKAAEFLAKYWVKGRRNQLEMAFLGYCLKRGVSYESARRIIERVCDLTNDEERAARLQLVDYHYKNRRGLGGQLAGVSLIREVVKEELS
jgi:hypothetical protein